MDDTIRGGRSLDTPNRRDKTHGLYSSCGSERHHHHHHYHLYMRSEKGYWLEDFKKVKPPTFDGEMKKIRRCRSMAAWDESKRLLRKKYLYEKYHDGRVKSSG